MERTLQVLLVEDNPGDIRLIREMLHPHEAASFQLTVKASLADGLEAMALCASDVILLDLSLPDSSGYETFRQAKPVAGNVPIVVLTGLEDHELSLQCVRGGAQDYLPKNRMADGVLERAIFYAVQRKAAETQRQLTTGVLQILNRSLDTSSMVADMLLLIKSTLSFEAAAIRLREGEDYPYSDQSGFSDDFVAKEQSLLRRDEQGEPVRDDQGRARLDGLCGMVIRGEIDSYDPHMSPRGSFWTSRSTALLETPGVAGLPRMRLACSREGFESIALIPIRLGDETIGLLHFADHRRDRLSADLVETLEGAAASIGVALKRLKAEADLAASEERYRRIVETSGDGVVTLDGNAVINYASRRAAEMTGWSVDELIGKRPVDFLKPEDAGLSALSRQIRPAAGMDEYEGIVRRKDGSDLWLHVSARPYRDEAGRMIGSLAMMRDITEQRRAQNDLAEVRAFIDRLVENAPVSIYATGLEGRYRLANVALGRLLGVAPEDLVGRLPEELFPPEAARAINEANRRVIEQRHTVEYTEALCLQGVDHLFHTVKYPTVDSSGAVTGVGGVSVDLTERLRAERALAESEERYRGLFQEAPIGILHSVPGGRYVRVNPAYASMLGYSSPEEMISTIRDIGNELYVDTEARTRILATILQKPGWTNAELAIRRKDGGLITIDLTTRAVRRSDGEVAYVEAFALDITKRLKAEQQVHELGARLEAILAAVPDIITIVNSDRVYTWLNRAGVDFFGDGVVGREAAFYFEGEQDTYPTVQLMFNGKSDLLYAESLQRRKDGEKRLLAWWCRALRDEQGTVTGALSTGRDITEQRRAEAALRDNEAWLRGVFEQAGVGIANTALDGTFTRVNRRYCEMLGYSEEELARLTFQGITHPEDLDRSIEHTKRLLSGEIRSYNIEKRFVRGDGSSIWVNVSVSLARDQSGTPLHYISVASDISERVQAEQELNEARAFTDQLLENAPVQVSVVDAAGTYKLANRALAALYGRDTPEIIGRSLSEFYTPAQVENAMRQNREVLVSRRALAMDSTLEFGGEKRYFRLVKFPVADSTGAVTGVAGVGLDISESRKAQEELRASEEKFRSVVEQSRDGFALCDAQGIIVEWNHALEELTGLMRSEVAGHQVFEALSRLRLVGPSAETAIASVGRAIGAFLDGDVAARPPLVEGEIEHPDGTRRTVESSIFSMITAGGPVGAIVMRDVSDRKRADAALRRYELLSEQARDIVFFVRPDGRIFGANRAATEAYGYSQEEMLGLRIYDLREPGTEDTVAAQMAAALSEGILFETIHRRKDGTMFPVEVSSRGADVDGERVVLSIVRDITDRKRLEEQFRQSQKMESVGRLAGGVAHDFNNLLTAINGYASFALEELPPEARARDDILEVLKAAARASKLTQQLLAFSRRQVLQPQVINLNDLVLDMEKMLRRLIGENIDLATVPDPNLAAILADPGHMEQILVNLAVNARDAMPHGGLLTIETANVTLDEASARLHGGSRAGEFVQLAITDNGTGMTDEVQSHLFEPFYTTKAHGQGTGLGLATIFGIVKQHQGNIYVYSEVGNGTTFKIYFPRAERGVVRVHAPMLVEDIPTGHETILVAEDEPAVRELSVRTLQSLGYNVLEATDGGHALEVAAGYEGRIDLLLTDVIMPRMGGKELAVQLTEQLPHVKVLFVSGYTEDGIVRSGGVLIEPTTFLQKPFTSRSLAFKIRSILDGPAPAS